MLAGILVFGWAWWAIATLPRNTAARRAWNTGILGASVFLVLVAGAYGAQVAVPIGHDGPSPAVVYMLQTAAVVTPGAVAALVRAGRLARERPGEDRTKRGNGADAGHVTGAGRNVPVAVEFFAAPDDRAAETGPPRGEEFPALECTGFDPGEAVGDWEFLLTGETAGELRSLRPTKNSGSTVFEVPDGLCEALAQANRRRLVEVAAAWAGLAAGRGEYLPVETAVETLTELADLAHTAASIRQRLYCWYLVP
ncbi:hypothetical protein ACFV2Q_04685 [Streptomyces sp. NPDC059650]|uniref:hypothetical protein n=1 Tax=Streptomyces sp. NPDC059650 TaxID=3346896 RepID=UPI00369442D8